jgi:diketogulonate reductase-like aldo/keto reductase
MKNSLLNQNSEQVRNEKLKNGLTSIMTAMTYLNENHSTKEIKNTLK